MMRLWQSFPTKFTIDLSSKLGGKIIPANITRIVAIDTFFSNFSSIALLFFMSPKNGINKFKIIQIVALHQIEQCFVE